MSIIDRQGIEVYLDPKGVVSGAAIARRSLQSLTLGTRNLLAGLTGVSGALGGLAIGYGVKSAIGIMADFESTMSAVEAVTGATGESFDALSQQAQELGASTKFTASQAAEGMKFLGMAGLEVNDILSAMPSMLDLASAGSLDLGRAADIASNAMSQFGLEASEMTRVADTLAFTAASSNTNIEQLADALNYAGNVAASFGIDIETLSAAIGVLGDNGIQGSAAGTQLRQSIASLASPTGSAATSLKEMADAAGLLPSAFEVGSQSFEDLIDNFAKARSAVGEFKFASMAFDIFGNRAAPAILALSKYNEEMRQAAEDTRAADGAAKRMADTMNRNLRGAMIEIGSAMQGVIINIDDKNSITGILREAAVELANIIRIVGGIQNPFIGISDGAIRLLSTIGAVPTGIKSAMDSAVDIIGVSLAVIPDLFEAAFKDAFDNAILWIERIANSMENSSVLQAFVKNNPVYSSATRAGYTPTGKNTDRGTGSITERAIPRLEEVLVKFKNDINKDTMLGVYNASKDYNKAIEENQRMFTAIRDMAEVVKGFAEDAKQFPQGVRSQTAFQAPIRSRLDVDPLRSFSEVSLIHEVKQSPEFKKAIQGVDTALYQKHIERLTEEHAAKEELINSLISKGNDLLSSRPPTLDQLRERETQILGALKQQGDVNEDNKANVEALNALLSDTRLQMESVNSQGSQFADLLEEATNLQESQIPTLDELVSKYDLINSAITEARETHGENSEEVKALNLLLSETREKIDAAKIASDGFANAWEHIKQGVDAYQDALSGLDDVPFKISQMLENVEDEITVQIMADNNIDLSSLGETIKEQIKKLAIEKMISEPIVRGLGEVVQQIGGAVMKSPIGDMIGGAIGKLGGVGGVAGDIIGAMIGAEKPENYEPITASIDTLGGINQAGFDKVAAAINDSKAAEAGKPQSEKDKTIPGQITNDNVYQAKPVPQGVFKADPIYQAEPVYKSDPVYQADPIFEAQPIFDAEAIFDATPIVDAISQSAESTNATTQAQTGMLGSIFNSVGSALGGVFNSVGGMLGGVFSGVGGSILGGLGGLGGSILGGLGGLGGTLMGGLSGIGGLLGSGFSGLSGVLGKGFSGLGNILNNGFGSMVSSLGGLAGNLLGSLGKKLGPIGGIVEAVGGFIGSIFDRGGYADSPVYSKYFSNSGVKSANSSALGKISTISTNSFANGGYSDNGVYSSNVQSGQISSVNSFANGGYSDNGVYSSNVQSGQISSVNSFANGGYSDNGVYSSNVQSGQISSVNSFANGGYSDNGVYSSNVQSGQISSVNSFANGGYSDNGVYSSNVQSGQISSVNSFANGGYSDNGVYSSNVQSGQISSVNSFANGGYSDNGVYSSNVQSGQISSVNSFANGGYSDNSVYSSNVQSGKISSVNSFANGGYSDNGVYSSNVQSGQISSVNSFANGGYSDNGVYSSNVQSGQISSVNSFANGGYTDNGVYSSNVQSGQISSVNSFANGGYSDNGVYSSNVQSGQISSVNSFANGGYSDNGVYSSNVQSGKISSVNSFANGGYSDNGVYSSNVQSGQISSVNSFANGGYSDNGVYSSNVQSGQISSVNSFANGGYSDNGVYSSNVQSGQISSVNSFANGGYSDNGVYSSNVQSGQISSVNSFANGGYSDNGVYSSNVQSGQISSVNSFANGGYSDNGVYSSNVQSGKISSVNSFANGGYTDNGVYSSNVQSGKISSVNSFANGGYSDNGVYSSNVQSGKISSVNSFANGGYSDNGVYSSNVQSGQISSVNSFANGGYSDNSVYSSPMTKTDVAHYNNIQYGSYARGGYSDNSVYSVNGFNDAPEFADGGYTGRDNGPLPGGGIPTITHPNEAIVPLPDGRNIPVEIVNNNQANNARSVNVTINVRNSSDIMRDSVRIKRMLGEVMA